VIVGVKMPFMLSLKKFAPSGVCEVGKKIISIKKLLSILFLGLKKVIKFVENYHLTYNNIFKVFFSIIILLTIIHLLCLSMMHT